MGVRYCQVPIQALLVNPDAYDGRKVATFGYLLHEGLAWDALGAVPDALRRIDFISCLLVDPKGSYELRPEPGAQLAHGIYFAMVRGTFRRGAVGGGCVGAFSEVDVSRMVPVDMEGPHEP